MESFEEVRGIGKSLTVNMRGRDSGNRQNIWIFFSRIGHWNVDDDGLFPMMTELLPQGSPFHLEAGYGSDKIGFVLA
jgi:hypothetical protein